MLLCAPTNHLSGGKIRHFLPVQAEPSETERHFDPTHPPALTTVRPSRVIAQLTQSTTLSCPCHAVRSPSEGPRQQTAGYCRPIRGPLRLAADFPVLCVCRQTNHGDGCDVLQARSQNMDWMMDGERGGRDQQRACLAKARLRPDDGADLRENTTAETLELQPEAGGKCK